MTLSITRDGRLSSWYFFGNTKKYFFYAKWSQWPKEWTERSPPPGRVTRLGEISPNRWSFILGIYLKISQVAQILGLLSSTVEDMHYFLQKGSGLVLGNFFSNSHGHPDSRARSHSQNAFNESHSFVKRLACDERLKRLLSKVWNWKVGKFFWDKTDPCTVGCVCLFF
jgi:hypothetical protein